MSLQILIRLKTIYQSSKYQLNLQEGAFCDSTADTQPSKSRLYAKRQVKHYSGQQAATSTFNIKFTASLHTLKNNSNDTLVNKP